MSAVVDDLLYRLAVEYRCNKLYNKPTDETAEIKSGPVAQSDRALDS